MHFERSLRRAIYGPWKDKYIDYLRLKSLLRDSGSDAGSDADDDDDNWTEEDEGAFVEELVNVQLEKVHSFQATTLQSLRDRTSACEAKLDPALTKDENSGNLEVPGSSSMKIAEGGEQTLREVLQELDKITKEMNELEKYSRINYTGFLKAAKKHDRRRGHSYRVRPLMQVRLSALPFNKEDYSPLLYRLSTMYAVVRQNLDTNDKKMSFSEAPTSSGERYTSHKFWVHPENLLELKTVILRRLPVLVYNPNTSKVAEGGSRDPTITSIYFDNPRFSLYNGKVDQFSEASSLRLRWYDQLSENLEIYCEKKTVYEDDTSSEQRITTKTKHVNQFIKGEYKMDKDIQKIKDRAGGESEQAQQLEKNVNDIQSFIKEHELQPVLRANYTRTAFQIPGDNRVRITLDTDLALIREDALDVDRPCREPEDWHRRDIDDAEMEYPFSQIRKGEISRFPFAILEIRVKGTKNYEWVSDLISSHLVKQEPKFSKFVHGVAQLFDDSVNAFPFWLNEVDQDIRKDPQQAFDEEQERRAKAAEDDFAVGSYLKKASPAFKQSITSPLGSPRPKSESQLTPGKATAEMTRRMAAPEDKTGREAIVDEADSDDDNVRVTDSRGVRSYLPSLSKYSRSKTGGGPIKLPPGVSEPSFWIKDEGPVKVEAKVWLANQRTYIKWQHVSILLASLSLGLFNAAGRDNTIARVLAIVYTIIAVFVAFWGYGIYMYRGNLIRRRSGKDLDYIFGPIVVCVGLTVALILNFAFKYNAIMQKRRDEDTSSLQSLYANEL